MMRAHRLLTAAVAMLGVLAGGLALGGAPALAAAPEVPVTSSPATSITSTSAVLEGTLNPHADAKAGWYFAYTQGPSCSGGPTTAHEPEVEGEGLAVHTEITGLELGRQYTFCLVATNEAGDTTVGSEVSFTTLGTAPLASTGAVSEIGQASANVTGTVTPNALETYYYYQYGPTTEYGQSTAPAGPGVSVGSGLSAVVAPGILVPLTPGVTYHYRLVAWNELGTSYGQDKTFATEAGLAPLAITGAASGVSVDEATISGTINPQGKETSYRFEYGENTEYGTQAFGTVLPEQGEQTVTLSLRGIDPNTTYHYRLVVSNPGGTAYGEDMTFTTSSIAFPVIAPTPPPLIALPNITFPAGNEEPTTSPGKAKQHAKKTHGKKKHKKARKKKKAGGKGKTSARRG